MNPRYKRGKWWAVAAIYPGWRTETCWRCRGIGVVDVGYMEVVPGECPECNAGVVWIHERSGVRALYPGGRFV